MIYKVLTTYIIYEMGKLSQSKEREKRHLETNVVNKYILTKNLENKFYLNQKN